MLNFKTNSLIIGVYIEGILKNLQNLNYSSLKLLLSTWQHFLRWNQWLDIDELFFALRKFQADEVVLLFFNVDWGCHYVGSYYLAHIISIIIPIVLCSSVICCTSLIQLTCTFIERTKFQCVHGVLILHCLKYIRN